MKYLKISVLLLIVICFINGQDIINDIGSSGEFIVRSPSDTLFVIDGSNGNVGIGTNIPVKAFDLKGEARFITTGENDGQFNFSYIDGDEAYFQMFNGNNVGLVAYSNANSPIMGAWTGGSLNIHPFTNGWTLDNTKGSLSTFDFDNMRFDLKGEARFITTGENDGQFNFSYIDGDEAYFQMFNGNNVGLVAISNANSPIIGAYTGGSLNIHPLTNGWTLDDTKGTLATFDFENMRVGIGTDAPTQMLEVADTIKTKGIQFSDGTVQTTASSSGGSGDDWGNQVVVSDATISGDGTSGNQLTLAQQGATTNQVLKWNGSTWQPGNDESASAGSADGDAWGVTGEDQSSSIGRTGNVGIGTATPLFPLDIQPSESGAAILLRESDGNNYAVNLKSLSNRGEVLLYNSGAVSTKISGYGITYFNGGNLGIGTADPRRKLHINSASTLVTSEFSNSSPTATWIDINPTNANADAGIRFRQDSSGKWAIGYDDSEETFSINSGSILGEMFNIKSSGNIGIGTSSPSTKLEVVGQVKITGGSPGSGKVLTSDSNGLATWQSPSSGADNLGNHTATQNVKMAGKWLSNDGGNEGVFVSTNGNVGIGQNVPAHKLHVSGSMRLNAYIYDYYGDNGTNGQVLTRSDWGVDWQDPPSGADGDAWGVGGEDQTSNITRSGSVGIGTSNFSDGETTYKLAVNGSIRAKEVIVNTGWSDFVFEEDYDLPTLEEIENHINEHGHLPDIPSEAEVLENGISLGEMNAKLLQKIEELTLYVIELQDQINEQKNINE